MNALIIGTNAIRQDSEGRYCLNDLHRASGGENRLRPSLWTENQQTQYLIAEIEAEAGIPALVSIHGGLASGTFACKELVYAYAMWISPAFNLRVIRAFDSLQSGAHNVPSDFAAALRLAADQQEEIQRQRLALADAQPKVEFAEAVRSTVDAITVSDMAKVLGTGQNRLFARLRADAILMADNRPYQTYIDRGYFRLVEMPWRDAEGHTHVTFKTLVTGKGQVWLQRRYAAPKNNNSLPSAVRHATQQPSSDFVRSV